MILPQADLEVALRRVVELNRREGAEAELCSGGVVDLRRHVEVEVPEQVEQREGGVEAAREVEMPAMEDNNVRLDRKIL